MDTLDTLFARLAEPFTASEVKHKPAVVSGSRCLAMAYVDVRTIMDRLDQVLTPAGWQDEYECLPDGSVVCRLRCLLGGEWITKVDAGGPSEQPDEGDRRKAAFSDALKRAAVKFGIGRYLYRLEAQWVDYDPKTKKIVKAPSVPSPARSVSRIAAKPSELPATGAELQERLKAHEAKLVSTGVCARGELLSAITAAGMKAGYPADLTKWIGPAIALAAEETRTFEAKRRTRKEVA